MRIPIELVLLALACSLIAGLVNQSVATAAVVLVLVSVAMAVVEVTRRGRRASDR